MALLVDTVVLRFGRGVEYQVEETDRDGKKVYQLVDLLGLGSAVSADGGFASLAGRAKKARTGGELR